MKKSQTGHGLGFVWDKIEMKLNIDSAAHPQAIIARADMFDQHGN